MKRSTKLFIWACSFMGPGAYLMMRGGDQAPPTGDVPLIMVGLTSWIIGVAFAAWSLSVKTREDYLK